MDSTLLHPGSMVLFGSGETLPSSGKAYEHLAGQLGKNLRISILETPAGFELNSEKVAGNIRDFLMQRLQNYSPKITIIPARKKLTAFSPDNPLILEPLFNSNCVFMGPGSPTYTTRQLKDSLAFKYLKTSHLLGSSLIFASAALLAMSRFVLPVYEIYKVGEDLHWEEGLNYFSIFGLNLVLIPHWNNQDGGRNLDTSRCYVGEERFGQLTRMLPEDVVIIGIDEQTALFVDFNQPFSFQVFGGGKVTLIKNNRQKVISSGQILQLSEIGSAYLPDFDQNIPEEIISRFINASNHSVPEPDQHILDLSKSRDIARSRKDWGRADQLRDELLAMGWIVRDTEHGTELEPLI